MARLTREEFRDWMEELAGHLGAGGLRSRLARANVLVSGGGTVDKMASRLHALTGGLEREGMATQVLLALWDEMLAQGLEEDDAQALDEAVEGINACLDEGGNVLAEQGDELRRALGAYESRIAERTSPRIARLTVLVRALPAVAEIARTSGKTGASGGGPDAG